MITEPKVTVLAYTMVTDELADILLDNGPDDEGVNAADFLAEFAGRACYQSWDRPNPKTATTAGYIDHILDVKHYSVLSHASVSFYIEGVSRSLTHELVRHRFLTFSQLSQRYVDSKNTDWVAPPLALDNPEIQKYMENHFRASVREYDALAELLTREAETQGFRGTLAKKRAREAARAVLPNETETKIVVSGNTRAWRDFLAQRWTQGADLEIQRLAGVLLSELIAIAPATFADFDPETPRE
jgi:thymidylate synthase (FAD)